MKIGDHIENAELVSQEGHVYKGFRTDRRYSAIHLFPFQLSVDRYSFFEQQVALLKKAIFEYNAAVPRVLQCGVTKTGSFPFLEIGMDRGLQSKRNC